MLANPAAFNPELMPNVINNLNIPQNNITNQADQENA